MDRSEHSRSELLLDLLAEEVAERLKAKATPPPPSPARPVAEAAERHPLEPEPEPELEPELPPTPPDRPHAARLMARLTLGLLALVVAINVPINRYGTTLATVMPDRKAVIVHDGLVVKEEDDSEIYVYRDGEFRWISSMDAFEHYGYTWGDVHVVEDGFLDTFEIGAPLHVLLKCPSSPHIYRLENDTKRWIVDIDAFTEEGHVWEDVRFVSCEHLRGLPDGETIPPGHGPPPQP